MYFGVSSMSFCDARSLANFFLDFADSRDVKISNISMQKIIFFAHGWHYVYFDSPLIKNDFEAWPYGPVVRCVYDSFKEFGDKPIQEKRAYSLDVIKNQKNLCKSNFSARQTQFLEGIFLEYGSIMPFRLVSMTHEKGSPWDVVYNRPKYEDPQGLKIPEELIEKYFKDNFKNQTLYNIN